MFRQVYEVVSEFNRGNYGVAYKVRHRKEQIVYIAKTVPLNNFTEAERKKALLELEIMKDLKHPHIVSYKESFVEADELIIVLEFCEMGDLSQHIKQRRQAGQHFSENLILNWLLQLVMALKYIHEKRILHRDIKAANVFLTAGCVIKLGDFGISKILSETVHSKTFVGTPYYMSPEMCQNQSYTNKSDIWSLGCVLFEVAALEYPFKGKNLLTLLHNITAADPENELPSCYSGDLRTMVKKLLTKDHRKRPSANDILFDPLMVDLVKGAMQKSSGNLRKQFELHIQPHKKQQEHKLNKKLVEEQERLVAEKLREVERLANEKLEMLRNQEQGHSLTLYEAQIQKNIEELQRVVKEGFNKLRGEEPATRQNTIGIGGTLAGTLGGTLGATVNSAVLSNTAQSITTKSKVVGDNDIAGETIKSVMMGTSKQMKDVPIDDDRTINSVMFGETNRELDKTIQSMLVDTLGQMQGTMRGSRPPMLSKSINQSSLEESSSYGTQLPVQSTIEESQPSNPSGKFRGNRLMKTIQQLHEKHEVLLKHSLDAGMEELENKLGDIQILSEEVQRNPQALLDNSLLDLTLSASLSAGQALKFQNTLKVRNTAIQDRTFDLSLTNQTNKTNKTQKGEAPKPPVLQRTQSPLEEPMTKSVNLPTNHELEDDYLNEQFEEYDGEEFSSPMASPSKPVMTPSDLKMQKERQEIADIYKSMLEEMEKPQRNKYLVMSCKRLCYLEIKEVSDESALNTCSNFRTSSSSGMSNVSGKKKS